jgi:hypothetical protein
MDYEAILESARREAGAEFVATFARELAYEWCEIYEAMSNRTTRIVRFQCGTFEYLYDDHASLEATGRVPYGPVTEARLVAVSGYLLGHFIAHSIGGAVDRAEVNVFVQLRALNRSWSEAGKRFREMEAYCEANPGTFCFNGPIYPAREYQRAKATGIEYVKTKLPYLLPRTRDTGTGSFNWDLLVAPDGVVGPGRFEAQYWRPNIDPSEWYVLAVAGSTQFRLRTNQGSATWF